MPISAQSLCLAPTYQCEPGSSPTSTVPSPGTTPRSLQRGHALGELGLDRLQGGGAVEDLCSHRVVLSGSVEEVPGAGEVHASRRRPGRPRSVSSSRTEPPGWTIARTPASIRICGPSSNGKNASEAATEPGRPLPRPRDREPAGVDPVDLAHADADRGAVVGEQDRVGLHRRQACQANARSASTSSASRVAGGERPGRRVVARRVDVVDPLHQHAAGDRRGTRRGRGARRAAQTQDPDVLLALRGPRPRRRRTPAPRSPR